VRRARGFTLIELIVALTIGGMALSAAAALLQGLGTRADTIQRTASRVGRDAGAELALRSLWANVRSVEGDSSALTFEALCETTDPWPKPCRGRLAIEQADSGYAIRLETEGRLTRSVTLWSHLPYATVRYLKDAARGGTWVSQWSDVVPSPAIAVIVGAPPDTLIVPAW
jgi:prepilin-type N-terminal cleavage/methylation domain-containing protein